jgi:hypothetical protein
MNLTSSLPTGAADTAWLPGDSVASFLKMLADSSAVLADDGPDGWSGMLISGLAGSAAALAVAILVAVYFSSGYRSGRDIVRHGLAAAVALGLLGFVAYDMRHAALAYLGLNPPRPEVEIHRPGATASAVADSRVEFYSDKNQTTRLAPLT